MLEVLSYWEPSHRTNNVLLKLLETPSAPTRAGGHETTCSSAVTALWEEPTMPHMPAVSCCVGRMGKGFLFSDGLWGYDIIFQIYLFIHVEYNVYFKEKFIYDANIQTVLTFYTYY